MHRQEQQAEKRARKKRRRENWRIFFLSAYATALVCLSVCLLAFASLNPPAATERPVAEPASAPILAPVHFAVFLPDGFTGTLSAVCLAGLDPAEGGLSLAVLPADFVLDGETVETRFQQEGAAGVLLRLQEAYGLSISDFFCEKPEKIGSLTRRFGDLRYTLTAPLSYYDPATGDAFLAAEGVNLASGEEALKLFSLSVRQEKKAGCDLTAAMVGDYFRQGFGQREVTAADVQFLLSVFETNFGVEQAGEKQKLFVAVAGARRTVIHLDGEETERGFLPSKAYCAALRAAFAAASGRN